MLVVANVTAEHTVDDTIHFYPDQGTLVTNTVEQIDAALWFSDDVGGPTNTDDEKLAEESYEYKIDVTK